MQVAASIEVDSYPVGLDISNDGRYVIVTSQGRGNQGGNAVNIYEVEYAEPEPVLDNTDGAAVLELLEKKEDAGNASSHEVATVPEHDGDSFFAYAAIGLAAAALAAGLLIRKRSRG